MNAPLPAAAHAQADPALTVLVADDIEASRQALAQIVESLGHQTVLAGSGGETLEIVGTSRPDLVLLDLLMPDLDGFEVTRILRQQVTDRWLPVIVTSSLRGQEHFIHALSRGADDYLPRPVNPALLDAKLRHYQRVLGLQAKLAGLAQRQQAIHESIADAVITVSEDGRISEANRAARHILATAEPVGESLRSAIGVDLNALLKLRQIELADRHGQSRPMSVSVGTWSSGLQTFTTIALHDLSEQRRIERMKDEFLATVSHELRTPLTSVIGALGLLHGRRRRCLARRRPGAGRGRPAQRRSSGAAHRRHARPDQARGQTGWSCSTAPRRSTPWCRSRRCQRGLRAAWRRRPAMDRPQRPVRVALVDPDRFLQIMANLLSNAIKHSPQGESGARQAARRARRLAHRRWRDRGPGIDPPSGRACSTSSPRPTGPTGVPGVARGWGCTSAGMLVERMGGQIAAESTPGQGSAFSVVFPAHQAGNGWLLCLARDYQRLARLGQWLDPLCRVESATDALGARALVERHGPPAALVADPQGQESADQFCLQLRSLAPGSAIVLTGDSIDARYAAAQGLAWVPATGGSPQPLVEWVRDHIQGTTPRS